MSIGKHEIQHDAAERQFYYAENGRRAYLSYDRIDSSTLDYKSTYVPEPLRHRGLGSTLVERALDYAKAEGQRVVPSCPFVKSFIDEHGEYAELAASR